MIKIKMTNSSNIFFWILIGIILFIGIFWFFDINPNTIQFNNIQNIIAPKTITLDITPKEAEAGLFLLGFKCDQACGLGYFSKDNYIEGTNKLICNCKKL